MKPMPEMCRRIDDVDGLRAEIARRDKIIDALVYQAERKLSTLDTDYGLLQSNFMLEEQVRHRTEELSAALTTLSRVRNEAEAARQLLEAAVDSISDGFALFDPEHRLILCNNAFRRIWGLAGELSGRRFDQLLSVAGRTNSLCSTLPDDLIKEPQAIGSGTDHREFCLANGQCLQIRERRTIDGCVVGLYTDVTDLKAAEARLRQQELARKSLILQSTLDTISQGIASFDADHALVAWNMRFFDLHGLPRQLACGGAGLADFLAIDGGFNDCPSPVSDDGPPGSSVFERTVPSGQILELSRFPMPDGGFVVTATDITLRKESEEHIRQLLTRQRAIFENAYVGIILARERVVLDANPRMAEIFGYAAPEQMIGRSTEALFTSRQDYLATGERMYRDFAEKGYSEVEVQMRRQDGQLLWVHATGRPLDAAAPTQGSIWAYADVTRQREQQDQLELAQMVFNNSNEALLVTDADNRIISVNTAFTTITGYTVGEVIGQSPRLLKSGQHDDDFYQALWAGLLRDDRWEGEIIDRHRSGRLYPKWLTIRVVRRQDRSISHFVAAFSDISVRKAAEEKIQYMAHHDVLTGLPNRVLLRDRFKQMRTRSKRLGLQMAMFFMDLDRFKQVNDTLGHGAGDELLLAVSRRLKDCLRQSDTISRLGGDEFIILVEGAEAPQYFAGVAGKVLRSLDEPFEVGGHMLSAASSIGIAVTPDDGEDFDTLLKKSDIAMYHVKDSGRGSFGFFNERMNQDSALRLSLTTSLRKALANRELRLVYQPQIGLADGRITGVEALMRWRSGCHGDVSPAQFIPIAEETGLILSLGEWALHESCRQARQWHDAGRPIRMAVNVSAVQVYRDDFQRTLLAALGDTRVDPRFIELELTESTLMKDAAGFADIVADIRALGISVAIDDFGTGYSSLAYLKRFHVTKLKIDQSFVTNVPSDNDGCTIVEAIVRMGQSLKLQVIAEGVETREQFDYLAAIGCDQAQGYYLSRPLEAEAVSRFV
jgi:diguanylate cyclase (GGDEF)-like protein/PAS domain S-box-containing protein